MSSILNAKMDETGPVAYLLSTVNSIKWENSYNAFLPYLKWRRILFEEFGRWLHRIHNSFGSPKLWGRRFAIFQMWITLPFITIERLECRMPFRMSSIHARLLYLSIVPYRLAYFCRPVTFQLCTIVKMTDFRNVHCSSPLSTDLASHLAD